MVFFCPLFPNKRKSKFFQKAIDNTTDRHYNANKPTDIIGLMDKREGEPK